jgi:hypothetical protein
MSSKTYRVMHKFWLDLTKDTEYSLDEQIHNLKKKRTYTKTIRDGIRLISDLREGRLEVLFELFPWVRAEFLEYMSTLQQQPNEPHFALQQQLARLESLLLGQGNAPMNINSKSPKTEVNGPKKMVVPQVAAPALDDDDTDLLVVAKAKSSGNASQNFLNSAFKLIQ